MDPSRVMVGRQAVVLVDNVPGETTVLLLNRGLFTVYVGGPYVDGPSTGVPLAPLGSLAVPADRQWCAVADPAAQGAAQAVYRVPGGTSYSPAPSEIAAQIQASHLAAQIGTAVAAPGAAAIAAGIYNQGVRAVDAPNRTSTQLYFTTDKTFQAVTFDVSQANSVDIAWYFMLGTSRAAGTRTWAMLNLLWQDVNGNVIHNDGFELSNENVAVNQPGHQGAIRVPALGASLRIVLQNNQWGAPGLAPATSAAAADSAIVNVTLSSRATDRTRYFPATVQGGAFFGPAFTGLLYGNVGAQAVAAGATSPRITVESFSGPMEFRYLSNGAPGNLLLFAGAIGDGNPSFADQIPLTSGARGRLTVPGIRSQYTVALQNTGTVTTNFYFQAVASDY